MKILTNGHKDLCRQSLTYAGIDVVWTGHSHKITKNGEPFEALPTSTKTGALIEQIEALFPELVFKRMNLVHYAPISAAKLRYPTSIEMDACVPLETSRDCHIPSRISAGFLDEYADLLLGGVGLILSVACCIAAARRIPRGRAGRICCGLTVAALAASISTSSILLLLTILFVFG